MAATAFLTRTGNIMNLSKTNDFSILIANLLIVFIAFQYKIAVILTVVLKILLKVFFSVSNFV